jgi:hypothetical protein
MVYLNIPGHIQTILQLGTWKFICGLQTILYIQSFIGLANMPEGESYSNLTELKKLLYNNFDLETISN